MAEHRIVIDEGAQSDARLLYVLEELGRMQMTHEERVKAQIENLREYIVVAVQSALAKHMEALAHPEDRQLKPVAVRASNHVVDHWWGWLSKKGMAFVVGVVVAAVLIWAAGQGIVFKGVPKA